MRHHASGTAKSAGRLTLLLRLGILITGLCLAAPPSVATSESPDSPMNWPSTRFNNDVNFRAQSFVDRGNAAYHARDYAAAVNFYSELIKLKPVDPRAYYNRGNTYFALRDFDSALADFNKVLDLDPTFYLALVNRGSIYSGKRNWTAAIADYDKAIQLKPNEFLVRYNRGAANDRRGDFAAAVRDFDEALRIKPDNAASYAERGLSYLRLNKEEEARRDFETALKLNPGNERAKLGNRLLAMPSPSSAPEPSIIASVAPQPSLDAEVRELIEVAATACFEVGEFPELLEKLATTGKWRGLGKEDGQRAGTVVGSFVKGWAVDSPWGGEISVVQSLRAEATATYVCSVKSKLHSADDYAGLRAEFEKRFATKPEATEQSSQANTSNYTLKHTEICRAKVVVVESKAAPAVTITITHEKQGNGP